jgi:hypothetical protein
MPHARTHAYSVDIRFWCHQLAEYPHIGLLDPRTGQLLHSWSGYVDAATLLDRLGSFVSSHSLDDLSATTLPRDSKPSSRIGKQVHPPPPAAWRVRARMCEESDLIVMTESESGPYRRGDAR